MTTLMILGASGLVGKSLLTQALAHPDIAQVVAPGRAPLPAHTKLIAPVVDFERLPADEAWWQVDTLACALGTTLRAAGSREAFRRVDHAYPLASARIARERDVGTFVLVSAAGANAASSAFYSRTKGELERDLMTLGFRSLTFVRPSLLGGTRTQVRPMESAGITLLGAIGPMLPRRYRVVAAEHVARRVLQAALASPPGLRVIESEAI